MQKLNLKMQTLNFPDTYWLALIVTKKTLKKEEVIEILLQNQNKFFLFFQKEHWQVSSEWGIPKDERLSQGQPCQGGLG